MTWTTWKNNNKEKKNLATIWNTLVKISETWMAWKEINNKNSMKKVAISKSKWNNMKSNSKM